MYTEADKLDLFDCQISIPVIRPYFNLKKKKLYYRSKTADLSQFIRSMDVARWELLRE
jgi:hypothetical protein